MNQETPWSTEVFAEQLQARETRYHINHPYHQMMARGELNKTQICGWVANRFYYQIMIPRKDAALMANIDDYTVRRQWIQRIIDHDGLEEDGSRGGIEAWLKLGEACGISRETLMSQSMVLPGVRFAVDAYFNFVRQAPWREGVCSSLTELFAPVIHQQRLDNWPKDYPWVAEEGLAYFRGRLSQARRDVAHGMTVTLSSFTTRAEQERALEILQFKLDVLWSMLDAMYMAYVIEKPPYYNESTVV